MKKRLLCVFVSFLLGLGILCGIYIIHEQTLTRYELRIQDFYTDSHSEVRTKPCCSLLALQGDIADVEKKIPLYGRREDDLSHEHLQYELQAARSNWNRRKWRFYADTYLDDRYSVEFFTQPLYPDYLVFPEKPSVGISDGKPIPEGTYGVNNLIAHRVSLIQLKKDHFELLLLNESTDNPKVSLNFYRLREDCGDVPFNKLKKEDFVLYCSIPGDPSPHVATTHVELPFGVYRIEGTYGGSAHIMVKKKKSKEDTE